MKYVITMKPDKQYMQGEYSFESKIETQKFLETLNNAQLEKITDITKYNKKSFKNAWYEFFN